MWTNTYAPMNMCLTCLCFILMESNITTRSMSPVHTHFIFLPAYFSKSSPINTIIMRYVSDIVIRHIVAVGPINYPVGCCVGMFEYEPVLFLNWAKFCVVQEVCEDTFEVNLFPCWLKFCCELITGCLWYPCYHYPLIYKARTTISIL